MKKAYLLLEARILRYFFFMLLKLVRSNCCKKMEYVRGIIYNDDDEIRMCNFLEHEAFGIAEKIKMEDETFVGDIMGLLESISYYVMKK